MVITTEDSIIRLFVALILGALIGYERQAQSKAAGLRTHTLVCVGACLCMIISIHIAMDAFFMYGYRNSDPERIAAQVISGVGFLGAGTIMANQKAHNVQGLTTAAGLWAVAALGLVVGAGYLVEAITGTIMILVVLTVFVQFEKMLSRRHRKKYVLHIFMKNTVGQSRRLSSFLQEHNLRVENFHVVSEEEDSIVELHVLIWSNRCLEPSEIIGQLLALKGITRAGCELFHEEKNQTKDTNTSHS